MSLVKCPECGKEVSDQAPTCPQCGRPLKAQIPQAPNRPQRSSMEKWWRISAILSVFSTVFYMLTSLLGWVGHLFRRN